MLFDYLFLTAIGLDWLILGLVIFGNKALAAPLPENRKNFFTKSLFNILLFLLFFLCLLKILFLFSIGFQLKGAVVPENIGNSILYFIAFQLFFSFIFFVLALLLYVKDGFDDDFRPIWVRRIAHSLIFSLLVDFILGLGLYLWMLFSILPANFKYVNLPLGYRPLTVASYWLALGLILAVVTYFIFYLAVRHNRSSTTVTGMSLSYLLVLFFAGLLIRSYSVLIAPDARFLFNNFTLFTVILLWAMVLFFGLSGIVLIITFFRWRSYLKNDFYFRYMLIRLGSFHAVSVVGFSLITLVPIVFFAWYK